MKKKNKWYYSSISIVLICILTVSAFLTTKIQNVNAARMYGVQQVLNSMDKDPFVVLELVPDNAMASLGYYVKDSEPVLDAKLLKPYMNTTEITDEANADRELPLKRKQAVEAYYSSIITEENSVVSMEVDSYEEQIQIPDNVNGWGVIEAAGDVFFHEMRVGRFIRAEEYGLEAGKGDYINPNETSEDSTEATTSTDTPEGTVTPEDTGSEEEPVYIFNPGKGKYIWVDDPNGDEVNLTFNRLYYRVNVESNDYFSQYVLERNNSENIYVLSMTPEELEERSVNGDLANGTLAKDITLKDVDLMYISNSTCLNINGEIKDTFSTYAANGVYTTDKINDISWDTAYNIYQYVVNTNLPVIVDEAIITSNISDSVTEAQLVNANNNVIRLAALLKKYNVKTELADTLPAYVDKMTDKNSDGIPDDEAAIGTYINGLTEGTVKTNGSVKGSVYVNSVGSLVNAGFSNLDSDSNPNLMFSWASGPDASSYDSSLIQGMEDIVAEITSDNFFNNINNAGYTVEYQKDADTGVETVHVWQPTLVKYIINYRYRRVTVNKDKIRVLDIEPTKYSSLTREKIETWLGHTGTTKIVEDIEIVQTSTSEFIGKKVDLNETYDLIYIGSCIGANGKLGALNMIDVDESRQGTRYETVYNDGDMNGLIYAHVGDTVTVKNKLAGLFNREYTNSNKTHLKKDNVETRFSGNDITKEKMEDLKAFVDAGYPVVVSDELYSNDGINTKYVDATSYMYEFMNSCIRKENLIQETGGKNAKLLTYINMPKLNLAMVSVPVEYSSVYNENTYDLSQLKCMTPVDGKYILNYTFEFSDPSRAIGDGQFYTVELFVDVNADGKYIDTEELDDLTVYETQTGIDVNYNELQTNVRYTVSRELPDSYRGVVPWQLKVSLTNNDSIRVASTGFSATSYKEGDEKTEINIYQLASSTMVSSSLNLQTERNKEGSMFKRLFDELETELGYKVTITSELVHNAPNNPAGDMNNNTYVGSYNNYKKNNPNATVADFYEYKFKDYDMLIIGFSDCYPDIANAQATEALKMFIESGRSVLFSHDTTSFANAERQVFVNTASAGNLNHDNSNQSLPYFYWGYQLNQQIRSLVGMDRYGITEKDLSFYKSVAQGQETINVNDYSFTVPDSTSESGTKSVSYYEYADLTGKDIAYVNGSKNTAATQVHGYSNICLELTGHAASTSEYDSLCFKNDYGQTTLDDRAWEANVTQVNQGQITSYPFNLNILEGNNDVEQNQSTTHQNRIVTTYKDPNNTSEELFTMNPYKKSISQTHTQYFQLDMQEDMVVWYCLAGGEYDASPNDVRNNYYIYNVNNVTYTGMGHFQTDSSIYPSSITNYEARLFVNTMIASYNSGKVNPAVTIVASEANKADNLDYIYRTYDKGGYIDDSSEMVNFYVKDNNIVNGDKDFIMGYYYPVAVAHIASDKENQLTPGYNATAYKVPIVIEGNGDIDLADFTETSKTSGNGTATKVKTYKTAIDGDKIIFLRSLSKDNFISGTPTDLENNELASFTVLYDFIDKIFSGNTQAVLPRIYVGAQTQFTYESGATEVTAEAFDYITIKQRSLFNLD